MEDGLRNILVGFIMVTLFGTLLLYALKEEGNLYGKDMTEIAGGSLNLDRFNNSIINTSSNAETLREKFQKQGIFAVAEDVIINGIFGLGLDMVDLVLTPFDLIATILNNIFGFPTWITNTILGILMISLIFMVWRLIKVGD